MLIFRAILAVVAVGFVAARPRSWVGAGGAAACAALGVATGAGGALSAVMSAGPPIAFIGAVMALALLADRSGLAERLAGRLARAGRGRGGVLFALVCLTCALLTAALSLDGAVVVMVPVIAALARRHGAPLRPLLLATVGVANSFSAALPAGNPTNLVVMERLGLSPGGFATRMLVPSLGAALVCAAVLWVGERRSLVGGYVPARADRTAPRGGIRLAVAALSAAAAADWISPLVGLSPWLPVSVVAALALAAARRRPPIALPLRLGVQIGSLLVVLDSLREALRLGNFGIGSPTLAGLALVAAAVTLGAALANNLPASAAAAALLSAGPGSYAALLGLSAGALATPHGSLATLVSIDMSRCQGTRGLARAWTGASLAAVGAGILLLRLTA